MRILNSIKKELQYGCYSKAFAIVSTIFILFVCFNLFSNLNQLKQNLYVFNISVRNAQEDGEDINALIEQSFTTKEENIGGAVGTVIENPIAYDYHNVANSLYIVSNEYLPSQIIELYSFIVSSVLCSVLGLYMMMYDKSNKTLKIKVIRTPIKNIIISKFAAGFIAITIISLSTFLISFIFGVVARESVFSSIDLSMFSNLTFQNDANIFAQIICSLLLSYIFYIIGFFLGTIFNGIWIPLLIIFSYNLFIPNLGVYDLKNLVSRIAYVYFDFDGSVTLIKPLDIAPGLAATILLVISAVLMFASYFIFKKKSKYITK